jgi:molybdate transport system substrate-binding protein
MNETTGKKLILVIAAVLCLVVIFFAIQGTDDQPGEEEQAGAEGQNVTAETEGQQQSSSITVSAASSLTEAFTDIATAFETEHPGTDVKLNFAGSGTLRMQIEGGASIDVFASASESHMNLLSEEELIEESSRTDFTSNTLVMVVPDSTIESGTYPVSLENLTSDSVEKIAIGNPETAPVGKYAEQALEEAGLWDQLQEKLIYAENVKQVLTYVETGEVEAGFVYRTDAESGQKDLYEITYTVPVNASISYPIAVINGSENKDLAQEFVNFVTGSEGQEILNGYGFGEA